MEAERWKNTYIYRSQYEVMVRNFIAEKVASGNKLSFTDFNTIDNLRPSKVDALGTLLKRHGFVNPMKILDVGCGLGGTARYLANMGHRVTGCDILPQFVTLGTEIDSLVGLSDKISLQNKGIYDVEVESNSFDLVVILAVLMNIPGQEPITKLTTFMKPGSYLYIEDYILDKETELTDSEKEALYGFLHMPFRKRGDFNDQFRAAGLEVVESIDMSRVCSEFAWTRAERILGNLKDGKSLLEGELMTYGIYCPQLLAHLENFTEAELRSKFPNVCERVGTQVVYSANRILRWNAWLLRKN